MVRTMRPFALVIAATSFCTGQAFAQMSSKIPAAVAAPGAKVVVTYHGVGAQIYECKAGKNGKPAWVFREPIAALIYDGKTVGRHYAGPTWENNDSSKIVGKVIGKAPGTTSSDIAWLKLRVVKHQGRGIFSKVNTVQRLDTHGGGLSGSCNKAGEFKSVAYSATYVFLHKGK